MIGLLTMLDVKGWLVPLRTFLGTLAVLGFIVLVVVLDALAKYAGEYDWALGFAAFVSYLSVVFLFFFVEKATDDIEARDG